MVGGPLDDWRERMIIFKVFATELQFVKCCFCVLRVGGEKWSGEGCFRLWPMLESQLQSGSFL